MYICTYCLFHCVLPEPTQDVSIALKAVSSAPAHTRSEAGRPALMVIGNKMHDKLDCWVKTYCGVVSLRLPDLLIWVRFGTAVRFKTHYKLFWFHLFTFFVHEFSAGTVYMCIIYIYVYTYMYVFNILYPIWKCTHQGFSQPTPCPPGPSADGPGMGWGLWVYSHIDYIYIYLYIPI